MKKFLALALALVMALALAVPAMAFTGKTEADEVAPLELSIELVEYENDKFFGIVGAAPSDRGYAKNEIVAAVVSLVVPKDVTPVADLRLFITGENVDFNAAYGTVEVAGGAPALTLGADGYWADIATTAGKQNYRWLVFAKVTGDDASISAEVCDKNAHADVKFTGTTFTVPSNDGKKNYVVTAGTGFFDVKEGTNPLFGIAVDEDFKSTALVVYSKTTGYGYKVAVNAAGQYIFLSDANPDITDATTQEWKDLAAIITDVFEAEFGFDFDLLGGIVDKKYFEGLVSYENIKVTADIAPWVAYVQVPDVIVVDPPKTGDATVLVGIVMAIVAAAGVVVFNKVRA